MDQRIFFIDTAKVVAVFLVVFTHLYTDDDPFRLWIYSFHMPLFFFISGMFHKVNNVIVTINTNFWRLIIPAISFVLLGTIVYVIINGIDSLWNCLYQSVKGILFGSKIPGNNVIWFLFALFWDNVFLNIVIKHKYAVLCIIVAYLIFVPLPYRWLHISQALFSFPFYLIGYLLKTNLKEIGSKHHNIVLWGMGGVILLSCNNIIQMYNYDVSMHFSNPGTMTSILRYPMFYVNGMIGTLGVIFISICIPENKIIRFVSRRLICILGLQYLFMLCWDSFIGRNQYYFVSFIGSVLIIGLCLFINTYLEKYVPLVIGKRNNK